jgi:ethanolamine-phosphate phospho-lyase
MHLCTRRGTNLDGAAAARAVLAEAAAAGGRVVAFFCESIISCGGQVSAPKHM